MPLIICPDCKAEISDTASKCPRCGHAFTTSSSVIVAILLGLAIGGFVLWFLTRNI